MAIVMNPEPRWIHKSWQDRKEVPYDNCHMERKIRKRGSKKINLWGDECRLHHMFIHKVLVQLPIKRCSLWFFHIKRINFCSLLTNNPDWKLYDMKIKKEETINKQEHQSWANNTTKRSYSYIMPKIVLKLKRIITHLEFKLEATVWLQRHRITDHHDLLHQYPEVWLTLHFDRLQGYLKDVHVLSSHIRHCWERKCYTLLQTKQLTIWSTNVFPIDEDLGHCASPNNTFECILNVRTIIYKTTNR